VATQREIIVRLRAEIADYQKSMADAAKSTDALGKQNQKTAQDATASAEKTRAAWTTTGTTLLAVGAAVTAVGAAAAKTGIDYNTLQQTSRAALKTLLGSAEAANAQMDKLDVFARTSPFSKAVFITAQQQLIGFGMAAKDVIPTLDAIQNAVAATGGSNDDIAQLVRIIAQVGATGKITAEDLNQFGQRGVDAATLIGSQMGKTGAQIRTEITAGTLGADEAVKALTAGMDQRFSGSAANVKATFAGATDRVKAAWRDLSGELMAPMVGPNGGGFLIDVANGAADAMRAFQTLPGPVKIVTESVIGLVGVTALLSGGFLTVKPKIDALNASLSVMNISVKAVWTTIGVTTAVLTIAALAFGAWAKSQADAKARSDSYKDSLDKVTGAITTNTRAIAFNNLEQDGTIDAAKRAGVSLDDLVTASIDPTSAAYQRLAQRGQEYQDAQARIRASMGTDRASQEAAGQSILKLQSANGDLVTVLQSVGLQQTAVANAQVRVRDEQAAGAGAADTLADATKTTTLTVEDQVTALGDLFTAQEKASGAVQSEREAQRSFQASIAGVNASVEQQIADLAQHYVSTGMSEKAARTRAEAETTVSAKLDISTEAGRRNQAALDDIAKSGWDVVTAQQANGATQTTLQATMATSRQAYINAAVALGMNAAQAGRLADQLGLIPANVPSKVTLNTAAAQTAVDAMQAKLKTLGKGAAVSISTAGYATTYQYLSNIQTLIRGINGSRVRVAMGAGGSGGTTVGATGGLIRGPGTGTSDSIHALVSNGEYIVKADAVQHYGPGYFDSLNAKRFASGGYVGSTASAGGSQSPPAVYVQNPFTGEYLLAQVAGVAGGVVAQAQASRTSAMSRGSR